MRELWRIAQWGLLGAVALVIAAYAASTDSGRDRIRQAADQFQQLIKPSGGKLAQPLDAEEGKRLAETVRLLAADRDRLLARIAALEHNIDKVTGSIASAVEPTPAAQHPPLPEPSAAPVAAAPATSEPATSEPAHSERAHSERARSERVMSRPATSVPAVGQPTVSGPANNKQATSEPAAMQRTTSEPAASEPASSEPAASESATSEPAASEPPSTEPAARERATSAAAADITSSINPLTARAVPTSRYILEPPETPSTAARPATAHPPASSTVRHTNVGVALGNPASSMDDLRQLWETIRKRSPEQLGRLQPATQVHERTRPAGGTEYQLIAGPIANSAAAVRLCNALSVAAVKCKPITYDGRLLAGR